MSEQLTAERIIALLGLKPHPTCGFVAETYRAQERIPDEALPTAYDGSRPLASVLYFLVTVDVQIRLHRIRSDQMYHHYLGTRWKSFCSTPTAQARSQSSVLIWLPACARSC